MAHGFGWFKPVVDWEELCFQVAESAELAGVDETLLPWYRAGSRLLRDIAQELDRCFALLKDRSKSLSVHQEVGLLMVHICQRQFRRDVLTSLKNELCAWVEGNKEKDEIQFCNEGLREAFGKDPNLVRGNRAKVQAPHEAIEWLWGSSAAYNRKHFEDKPYRVMYRKAVVAARAKGTVFEEWWQDLFAREFLAYHWLLPYPNINGTLISTSKADGQRQWWAIDRRNGVKEWMWAKDRP